MDLNKVEIVNFKAFGEKVKAWARGSEALPSTMQEFADQLASANIGVTLPERLKHIRFVQDDDETLTVRLPCKQTLDTAEAHLAKDGGAYPLPAFYERVFRTQPQIADMVSFQAERIGDYSIAQCG